MARERQLEGPAAGPGGGVADEGAAAEGIVRTVGARLVLEVIEPTDLMLQVAPVDPAGVTESLSVACDGAPLEADEVRIPAMARVHRFSTGPGRVEVSYDATVRGRSAPGALSAADAICYLRPSRYAEADRLAATARAEFAGIGTGRDLLSAVSSWVGTHLSYVPGSSRHTDGAVETLLQRQGVCRDYAHLVIALLRALDVPARLAAVYAPGLSPMDFHAVAEAAIGGEWTVLDATLLAPRSSLLRICTGRDAADTAFLSTYGGNVQLLEVEVSAFVHGELPRDDVTSLVALG
ncbi:MAG TPA: transglutaminase family protein [Acidimicrobiales bacterium]|nr:transglutaminase family protein [Acidimicrobiales bacterium]